MKIIIAGSRSIDKYRAFYEWQKFRVQNSSIPITEFVTGECPTGPDQVPHLIKSIYQEYSPDVRSFVADWDLYGKGGGPIRNKRMAEYGDLLVLIWDGKSRGSMNMKQEMEKLGKPIDEIICST